VDLLISLLFLILAAYGARWAAYRTVFKGA
jgi:hypothetical protein